MRQVLLAHEGTEDVLDCQDEARVRDEHGRDGQNAQILEDSGPSFDQRREKET